MAKAIKPDVTTADIINAITSDVEGLNGAPKALAEGSVVDGVKVTAIEAQNSLRAIGNFITSSPEHSNEFLSALYDRIGMVIYEGYTYTNHFAALEKGEMPFGWSIEDIYVNLINVYDYTMDSTHNAEDIYKMYPPDVKAAFYSINYRKKYIVSTFDNQLRQAFLSYDGVRQLVERIVQTLYKSAAWDEELATRYLLSRAIVDGNTQVVTVPALTPANGTQITAQIKSISTQLEFIGTGYNRAGVETSTPIEEQYLIVSGDYDAAYTVEVQSAAFNLDKVAYLGHRVLVRSFSFNAAELKRLKMLFTVEGGGLDPNYKEFSTEELQQLDKVIAVLVDRNFLQLYRNLNDFRTREDPDKLKWNHWLHIWKVLATSPFSNAVSFTTTDALISSVTVSPKSLSIQKGQSGQLTVDVKTAGFAPKQVNWELETVTVNSYVSQTGVVSVGANETNSELKVKVTSVADISKYDEATITVTE